jgi:hypothetical protein
LFDEFVAKPHVVANDDAVTVHKYVWQKMRCSGSKSETARGEEYVKTDV